VRRLVGVGGIAYAGLHGAELLEPNTSKAIVLPEFAEHMSEVQGFAGGHDTRELRALRVRIEDKGPIMSFHWRGAPDDEAAHALVRRIAEDAEAVGLWTHWGRKVLEIRPPVPVGKDRAVRELLARKPASNALYAGDDVTDLDGFTAIRELVEEGELDSAVTVGARSDEGPREIVEEADLVVDGIEGMQRVLAELDRQ
jgi:trehalose 6-phosphate phosphatase